MPALDHPFLFPIPTLSLTEIGLCRIDCYKDLAYVVMEFIGVGPLFWIQYYSRQVPSLSFTNPIIPGKVSVTLLLVLSSVELA